MLATSVLWKVLTMSPQPILSPLLVSWWETNYMNDLIDAGADVDKVTRRVNGGYNGLADRKRYYERCLQVI